ncbi:MAG: spore germination protein [Methylacidiphilales bacterium]|nr:spore germination protein [Candidatus Methylacidiphilales bacterium]NJR19811.1 spore germination protein [Calothrix sp. CSU_2_0]
MRDEQKNNRISSGVIAAVSAAVVAVSGGVAWFTWNTINNQSSIVGNPTKVNPANPQRGNIASDRTAEIYLLKDTGKNFELVALPVEVEATKDKPNEFLEAAFNSLLTSKNDGDTSSVIPSGTKILDIKVENDAVRVDLSNEFTSGGGSASMAGRVGQVVYTATSLNKNAKVYINVNGKELDVLGGEGLELEQPLTRESFQKNYQL